MQKTILVVFSAMVFLSQSLYAGITEGFESPNARTFLAGKCWVFPGTVELKTGNPLGTIIEGTTSMITSQLSNPVMFCGIQTPYVTITSGTTVSFSYKLNMGVSGGIRRWFKLILISGSGNSTILDSVNVNNTSPITYNRTINGYNGVYRIFILTQGTGGSARMILDNFSSSADYRYENGCNRQPSGTTDRFCGGQGATISGNVLSNDSDPDGESLTAQLQVPATNGSVTLNSNGTFTYVPNPSYAGADSFTYRPCDTGYDPLCGTNVVVRLNVKPYVFTENFDRTIGGGGSYETFLNSQCWLTRFVNVNTLPSINRRSINSDHRNNLTQDQGFSTPFLNFDGCDALSFNYRLDQNPAPGCRRFFLVRLVSPTNQVIQVDSVEVSGTSINAYNKSFTQVGSYRIQIIMRGVCSNIRLGMDDIAFTNTVTAPCVPRAKMDEPETTTELLEVYPNPTQGRLQLRFNTDVELLQVAVYDLNGTRLMESKESTLDLGSLAAGQYLVKAVTANAVHTQRILVNP